MYFDEFNPMPMAPPTVIEANKRLSESYLWTYQTEYFHNSGIDAWVNQVPFYVTSNPFISNCYADLFIQFVRDSLAQNPAAKQQPFYILELGTGSGRFSFYVLKKLAELRKDYGLEDVKICYVMSDFTNSNVTFWDQHPALAPFVAQGLLDFAVFNMEADDTIKLIKQNITLTSAAFANPLTVFANYIFDTVTHDAFCVNDGKLSELVISMSSDPSNVQEGKPINWDLVHIDYQPETITQPRYADQAINKVLMEYEGSGLTNTNFLFPIGGIQAIKKLLQLANNKLFLISSDKGYASLESMDHLDYPRPSFHGSFSMMVNFHAIGRYFKQRGGDYVLQTPREGIKTAVFSSGFNLTAMPNTGVAIKQHIEELSPADYFALHRRVRDYHDSYDLATLASHLVLTGWDPHIYNRISRHICSLAYNATDPSVEFLANNMHKLMANFYLMPNVDNLPFEIGTFYLTIGRHQQALEYYHLAAPLLGEQFSLYFNYGLCHYYLGDPQTALKNFQRAAELEPESPEAKEWITFITNPPLNNDSANFYT